MKTSSGQTFAFVMDPLERVDIDADTTFVLMLEAQRRGHRLLYIDPADLGGSGLPVADPWSTPSPATPEAFDRCTYQRAHKTAHGGTNQGEQKDRIEAVEKGALRGDRPKHGHHGERPTTHKGANGCSTNKFHCVFILVALDSMLASGRLVYLGVKPT